MKAILLFKALSPNGGWPCLLQFGPKQYDFMPPTWREGRAYMTTMGAGAYLVDPKTGVCEGVEGTRGHTLQLVPSGLRRLRKLKKLFDQEHPST